MGGLPLPFMKVSNVLTLVKKELKLEFRQRYALGGILLYVISMVFVIYSATIKVDPKTWNVLFWIIVLFASVNAITKSFIQESGHRQLFYYQLADPREMILSKIIYNVLLLFVLSVLAYLAFGVVAGDPVKDLKLFSLTVFLASLGFSISFTFISAIAGKSAQTATLMAILSFPAILPILLLILKLSANALRLIQDTGWMRDIYSLIAIDVILISLAFILFPYLWRD